MKHNPQSNHLKECQNLLEEIKQIKLAIKEKDEQIEKVKNENTELKLRIGIRTV
jgi:hypothetical protein